MLHLICFRVEIPFLDKFGPKNQNCGFRLKFGIQTNPNMQNSIGMFTFLGFGPKYLFWVYLVQKFEFVCSGKSLLPRLIQICRTQWQCSLHLTHSLSQIKRTQWRCSLFLFFNNTPFYGKFIFKKSKLCVEAEIWNADCVKFDGVVFFLFQTFFSKYCPKKPFGILMLPD